MDVLIEEDVPMPPEEAYEIAVRVYEWAKGIVEGQP